MAFQAMRRGQTRDAGPNDCDFHKTITIGL
jgi:hypothetical protein